MASTSAAPYQLMDADNASLLGGYASEEEALHAVAAAAEKYGSSSEAVLNLVLFREDGPEDQAFIAAGYDLVRQALAAVAAGRVASVAPGGDTSISPTKGAPRESSREAQAGSRRGPQAAP